MITFWSWLTTSCSEYRVSIAGLNISAFCFANFARLMRRWGGGAGARGGLAAGDLSPAQAVFALLLGNGLGILTRAVRQNAGYYFGLFPPDLARSMLFWNVGTMLPLVLLSLLLAALPLG